MGKSSTKGKDSLHFIIILLVVGLFLGFFVHSFLSKKEETKHVSPEKTKIQDVETINQHKNKGDDKENNTSPEAASPVIPSPSNDKAEDKISDREEKYILPEALTEIHYHKVKDQKNTVAMGKYTEFYENVVKVLDIKKGETVADIGSGHGWMAFIFSQAVGSEGIVYSTDINDLKLRYQLNLTADMIKKYGSKVDYFTNLRFRKNEMNDLLLPPDHLDWAVMTGVHIFCYDPEAPGGKKPRSDAKAVIKSIHQVHGEFAKSLARSVKPGGKLVIIEGYPCDNLVLNEDEIVRVMGVYGFIPAKEYEGIKNKVERNIILVFRKKKD